ncbi:MAG: hypothetical protein ABI843_16410 [Dokdonella sp.]
MPLARKLPSFAIALALSATVLIAGCATRSISNSGYVKPSFWAGRTAQNPLYRGELSEFDLLGIDPMASVGADEIEREFRVHARPALRTGTAVMLIQSGAMIPDATMTTALGRYYEIAAFSGIPQEPVRASTDNHRDYSMNLRLAAAKGGYPVIIVYWGVLETAVDKLGTKAVSWIPFAGSAVRDEQQRMRIRLKIAVLDTRSGQWEMLAPQPLETAATSARRSRESSDQSQVEQLKHDAYEAAASEITKRYAEPRGVAQG